MRHDRDSQAETRLAVVLEGTRSPPVNAEDFNALGIQLLSAGDALPALAAFRRALDTQSDFPEAVNNLGNALKALGDTAGALEAYARVCEMLPSVPEAHCNLGSAWQDAGRADLALPAFRRALELRPDFAYALGQLANLLQRCAQWPELDAVIDAIRARIAAGSAADIPPFNLLSLPRITAGEQTACARQECAHDYADALATAPRPTVAGRREGPLRIGYLSADFHAHATSWLLTGVLETHRRDKVEVHAFSYGPDDHSDTRKRVMKACDAFHEIAHLGHHAAANLISNLGIDILVDLKGHTRNARPEICALRPAPLIVNWLGYPGSLGHPRLADYLIGDPVVTPATHAADYAEALALMPFCYQPNDAARRRPVPGKRSDHGLPDAAVVFCSFNQTYKLTPDVFDDWCAILASVPDGVLWMLAPDNALAAENLRAETLRRGIAPQRLHFAPPCAQDAHMDRLPLADIALDTFPYTSHTTGSDALWAGVPLLTRIGDTFPSRVAASLLTTLGLTELIVSDRIGFVRQGIRLGHDPAARQQLRQRLLALRAESPLFDSARFARDLEALYAEMWRDHAAGIRRPIAIQSV